MSSPILKSFTFVPQPKPNSDPLIIKRERMVSRLEGKHPLWAAGSPVAFEARIIPANSRQARPTGPQ